MDIRFLERFATTAVAMDGSSEGSGFDETTK